MADSSTFAEVETSAEVPTSAVQSCQDELMQVVGPSVDVLVEDLGLNRPALNMPYLYESTYQWVSTHKPDRSTPSRVCPAASVLDFIEDLRVELYVFVVGDFPDDWIRYIASSGDLRYCCDDLPLIPYILRQMQQNGEIQTTDMEELGFFDSWHLYDGRVLLRNCRTNCNWKGTKKSAPAPTTPP